MSIGALAIGEAAIAAQAGTSSAPGKKPPKNRQIVAKADAVTQPEAR